MQINPSASNRFKKTDNVAVYTEVYEPLLTSPRIPRRLVAGYAIVERGYAGKSSLRSGRFALDDFIQKGSPMVPVGMDLKVRKWRRGVISW